MPNEAKEIIKTSLPRLFT